MGFGAAFAAVVVGCAEADCVVAVCAGTAAGWVVTVVLAGDVGVAAGAGVGVAAVAGPGGAAGAASAALRPAKNSAHWGSTLEGSSSQLS